MKSLKRLLGIPALYVCWLGMMAVHEAGHVLHARLSGGVVDRVDLPLLGFSQTLYSVNPKPQFVAWGGPIWGSLVPLMVLAVVAYGPPWLRQSVQFFAGLCLVANGAYLGVGWTTRAGDAGDLIRYGTPIWVLVVYGLLMIAGGLYLWHLLGRRSSARRIPA